MQCIEFKSRYRANKCYGHHKINQQSCPHCHQQPVSHLTTEPGSLGRGFRHSDLHTMFFIHCQQEVLLLNIHKYVRIIDIMGFEPGLLSLRQMLNHQHCKIHFHLFHKQVNRMNRYCRRAIDSYKYRSLNCAFVSRRQAQFNFEIRSQSVQCSCCLRYLFPFTLGR